MQKNRRSQAFAAKLIAIAAVVVAGLTATAGTALAGGSVNMWLGAGYGYVKSQQVAGVSGWYHMDLWFAANGAVYGKTGDYYFDGRTKDFYWRPTSGVRGETLCGQLWYNNPNGTFQSQGLPCQSY